MSLTRELERVAPSAADQGASPGGEGAPPPSPVRPQPPHDLTPPEYTSDGHACRDHDDPDSTDRRHHHQQQQQQDASESATAGPEGIRDDALVGSRSCLFVCLFGATENARPENAGLETGGQLRKESQGLENTGLENDGPC